MIRHLSRYVSDRAFAVGRFVANGFLVVCGLVGLASLCALVLVLAP